MMSFSTPSYSVLDRDAEVALALQDRPEQRRSERILLKKKTPEEANQGRELHKMQAIPNSPISSSFELLASDSTKDETPSFKADDNPCISAPSPSHTKDDLSNQIRSEDEPQLGNFPSDNINQNDGSNSRHSPDTIINLTGDNDDTSAQNPNLSVPPAPQPPRLEHSDAGRLIFVATVGSQNLPTPSPRAVPQPSQGLSRLDSSDPSQLTWIANTGNSLSPDVQSGISPPTTPETSPRPRKAVKQPRKPAVVENVKQAHGIEKKKLEIKKPNNNKTLDKPEAFGKPKVFAEKRQALCETLVCYQAYQSAAYTNGQLALGFMIDKEVGEWDFFDDEIVIARIGGGRTFDKETNMMVQNDQTEGSVVTSFKNSKESKTPVVVITGRGNHNCPTKLLHYYNVLDWFHVTNVWAGVSGQARVFMVRLEKVNLLETSWWAPKHAQRRDFDRDLYSCRVTEASCRCCKQVSKEIFSWGWTCLQMSCAKLHQFGIKPNETELTYTRHFLDERTAFLGQLPPDGDPRSLVPSVKLMHSEDQRFNSEHNKQGVICPECGNCIRMNEWTRWFCDPDEGGCGYVRKVHEKIVSLADAMIETKPSKMYPDSFDRKFGIRSDDRAFGAYKVDAHSLPNPDGRLAGWVFHFRSNDKINSMPGGPDQLFEDMQVGDFDFRRRPCRQPGSVGEILTSHWASNYGVYYKFGVEMKKTTPLTEAPVVVLKALSRMIWAGKAVHGDVEDPPLVPNECLALAYGPKSSINFHDDGEKELGPTVVTLSLGASSIMEFRPKLRRWPKDKLTSKVSGEPSNDVEAETVDANEHESDLLSTKPGRDNANKKAKANDGSKPKQNQACAKFRVNHGDMVIMHGAPLQEFYEHAVTPKGRLRFALTARHIVIDRLANEEIKARARHASQLPSNFAEYEYDGLVHPTMDAPDVTDGNSYFSLSNEEQISVSKPNCQGINIDEQAQVDSETQIDPEWRNSQETLAIQEISNSQENKVDQDTQMSPGFRFEEDVANQAEPITPESMFAGSNSLDTQDCIVVDTKPHEPEVAAATMTAVIDAIESGTRADNPGPTANEPWAKRLRRR